MRSATTNSCCRVLGHRPFQAPVNDMRWREPRCGIRDVAWGEPRKLSQACCAVLFMACVLLGRTLDISERTFIMPSGLLLTR